MRVTIADPGLFIPGLPGTKVCPVRRGIVLLPIVTWVPEGARLIIVPDTVIAVPPGMSVLLPIIYCEAGLAVIGWSPIVMTGALTGTGNGIVLPATTIALADSARDTGVP